MGHEIEVEELPVVTTVGDITDLLLVVSASILGVNEAEMEKYLSENRLETIKTVLSITDYEFVK